MSTLPLSGPKFRAFDANGDPLSGGKLYAYAAGTTTPLQTYTTRAGDTPNTNPVVLNANGEADVWTATGVLYKFVLKDATDVTQWTVDNVPSGSGETPSADLASALEAGGRLSLASGNAIPTTDVTGATTVYYVPFKHNKVPLYDGSGWLLHTVASQLSQASSDTTKSPAAVAASSVYDVFIWDDAGTLRLSRGPAWTSDTARGTGAGTTELDSVDARYVNKYAISNGPAAQKGLYVGTIRSDGSSQLTDSFAKRRVWNANNRLRRPMRIPGYSSTPSSWTYNTATLRQANADTVNQLDYVCGLPGEPVFAEAWCDVTNNAAGVSGNPTIGIGIDSTTVSSGMSTVAIPMAANVRLKLLANYEGFPGIGRHIVVWLEAGGGSGTSTFISGLLANYGGIWGHLFG